MDNKKFTDFLGKLQNDFEKIKAFDKFKNMNTYIQDKKKLLIIGSLSGIIIIGSSYGVYQYSSNVITVYHVYLNGQEVGVVNDFSLIDDWKTNQFELVKEQYQGTNIAVDDVITYEEKRSYNASYDNEKVLESLKSLINIEAVAVEIVVDGKVVGIVRNQEIADRLMSEIKELYLPNSEKGFSVSTASVEEDESSEEETYFESVDILEDVSFNETNVSPDEITSEEDMLTLLNKGTLEEKVYTVIEGDTISEIASKFDLNTSEVYQMNPEISGELINIDDELVVTAMTPLVTVQTTETTTQIERIPYTVEYQKDDSMFINETKTVVYGAEGEKRVEYSIIKENGIIIEKVIQNSEIVKEPSNAIVKKGTKIVPSKGSGTVDWPTVGGIITSGYGPRWGNFHYGIDISGVSDRTIKAADNGVINYAGWKGGYGYCVIIDHGSGIQTLYGHLSSYNVSVGDKIAKGQKLGIMGSTGISTGVHLHFEVIVNGEKKNPINYVGY